MGRTEDANRVKAPKQRIAIIGSGIAGQTAAYFLSERHEIVAIYEASERPGLHTHSINLDGYGAVDVPLRAYSPHYYPNLARLYEHLGIQPQPVNYSSTGVDYSTGNSFFQYYNLLILRRAIPFLWGRQLTLLSFLCSFRIVRDLLWMVFTGPFLLLPRNRSKLRGKTLGEHVRETNYSFEFVHYFLYPVMSTLLSCSYAQVDAYPAEFILEFYSSRSTTIFTGWSKVPDGVEKVSEGLLSKVPANALRLATKVMSVTPVAATATTPKCVKVVDADGNTEFFDHVIIATEPNIAKWLWKEQSKSELELLSAMDTYTAEIVVHRDASLMPVSKDMWSGMNYYTFPMNGSVSNVDKEKLKASMTSVWVNRYTRTMAQALGDSEASAVEVAAQHASVASQPSKRSATPTRGSTTRSRKASNKPNDGVDLVDPDGPPIRGDLFQTWNPYHEPSPGTVVSKAMMTRAVWTVAAQELYIQHFAACQGAKNIWLCGSYCSPGVTLLENAVKSALDIAQDFGVEKLPFEPTTVYESRRWSVAVSYTLVFWRRLLLLIASVLVLAVFWCRN